MQPEPRRPSFRLGDRPRRPPRRSVHLLCEVVRERDFRRVGRQILDLSEEGLLVATSERVLTGEAMIVTFQAPFSLRWIDAEATVARVVHGRRPADRGRALGLRFDVLAAPARAALVAELGWFRVRGDALAAHPRT